MNNNGNQHQILQLLRDKVQMLYDSQRIAHIGSWSMNLGSGYIDWTDEMYRIFDIKPEDFAHTSQAFLQLLHVDDLAAMIQWMTDCLAETKPTELDFRILLSDGSIRFIRGSGGLQYDEHNKPIRIVGNAQDITERKQSEKILHQMKAMVDISIDGFWIVDMEGFILKSNEAYSLISGYSIDELTTMHISQLEAMQDEAAIKATITKIIAQGRDRFETRHRHKNGHEIEIEVSVAFLPEYEQFCAFFRDITEQKKIELDLSIAATAFESQDAMVITDTSGVVLRINKAFSLSTGYEKSEIIGQKINILKSGRHDSNFYAAMWESIQNNHGWQGEIWDRRKNGEIYPKWLSITAVKGNKNNDIVTHYIGTHLDITERKAAEDKIKQLAFYDPLTQLPNRRLLQDRLSHSISIERRKGKILGVLMLDLDRFKAVNDSFGHLAGDELLQQVATRITAKLRDVDTVARLGGDEFIVLLDELTHEDDAARVAKSIIQELAIPFHLTQSDNVQIGTSIGISLYPQHGKTPELLIDHADVALYQAKDAGRGCFAYFSEELTLAAKKKMALETRLRLAIERHELRVFYQPQVDIISGKIIGAEALVRWQDPQEGLIPPSDFIPLAEETGLILAMGEWVFRETCRQGQAWLDAGLPPLTLAVNVSSYQFCRCDISALVKTVLEETNFPANLLELEITESGLMKNKDNAVSIMKEIRNQGVSIAIDDFGTGYSSLAYLKHFPLHILKIDKSFIDDVATNRDDREIASIIIAMGHTLGLKVLAEGVETLEQFTFLQEHGCDIYQGYLKSKPLPADEFEQLLQKIAALKI